MANQLLVRYSIAKTCFSKSVPVVQHILAAAMRIHKRVFDHLRVPPLCRTLDSRFIVLACPIDGIQRFGVADPIALVLISSIVEAATKTVPHTIDAILLNNSWTSVGLTLESVVDARNIISNPIHAIS